MSPAAEILAVCTGNVCRSPLTERLLRAGLETRWGPAASDVVVHSAGTRALVGRPMVAESESRLADRGGDATGFAARQLEAQMTRSATLVLALTRAHRAAVVEEHPLAARYTFTLREIARLLADVAPSDVPGDTPADRVRGLASLASRRRGLLPPVPPDEDDVIDPYGGDAARHDLAGAQITPAVGELLRLLAPTAR
ncbi:MAG: low molecular weight protein-tyrosine phosphatase [Frankiaceae bacterium]|nr:low molecular weight protein-tyrosine phosphatase [Frankiaceae bacterium]